MKVIDVEGAALDWAVTKCEGFEIVSVKHGRATFIDPADDGALNEMPINYSTDWAQGGPIIERERIAIWGDNRYWEAELSDSYGLTWAKGPTPLVAAMRCYVSSKVGEEIEVPDELLQGEEA